MIRFLDLFFVFLSLFIILPLLVLIAFFVLIIDGPPVFYSQYRVGKGGKLFKIWKFRTMINGADKKGLLTTSNTESRITKSGSILRKSKLDEIPQLWNVLKGEMSIVGPRPEVEKYVQHYNEDQKKILNISPGITDWASIKYKNENHILSQSDDPESVYISTIMPNKLELNKIYLNNRTAKMYLKILFYTLLGIFKSEKIG